ncbi:hypothetical protein O1D23_002744 [Vibrio cholerae]|nr:hypothetical protein [Vibrio cholerae]
MINSILITFFKLSGALILTKVVLYEYGSEGLVIIGSIINVLQIMMTLLTVGLITSTITVTSKLNDEDKFKPFTIILIILTTATLFLLLISYFLYNYSIDKVKLLNHFNPSYFYITCCAFLFSFKSIVFSTLNGLRKMNMLTLLTFLDVFMLPILIFTGVYGEHNIQDLYFIYLLILNVILVFLFLFRKLKISFGGISVFNKMKPYILMTMISSIITPLTLLIVRGLTDTTYGYNISGAVQGAWRLGDALLTSATGILGLYYLPKFASLNIVQVKKNVVQIMPILLVLGVFGYSLYFFTNAHIITLLLSEDLVQYKDVFDVHIFGVSLRILSYYLGLFMVSHGKSRIFIIHELTINVIYIICVSVVTYSALPYVYIPLSFVIVSALSIVITLFFFIKVNDKNEQNNILNNNTSL